jgi:hypothetical protein
MKVCATCNDTHMMLLDDREVMCTRCPRPCERCRSRGPGLAGGPYCAAIPCGCSCHGRRPPATKIDLEGVGAHGAPRRDPYATRQGRGVIVSPTDDDVYTTPNSYIAALEAHGATAGDIPRMLSTLRQQSARICELEAGIETLLGSAYPHPVEHPAMTRAWTAARTLLEKAFCCY